MTELKVGQIYQVIGGEQSYMIVNVKGLLCDVVGAASNRKYCDIPVSNYLNEKYYKLIWPFDKIQTKIGMKFRNIPTNKIHVAEVEYTYHNYGDYEVIYDPSVHHVEENMQKQNQAKQFYVKINGSQYYLKLYNKDTNNPSFRCDCKEMATKFSKKDAECFAYILDSKRYFNFSYAECEIEEVVEPKTCDGKIVKVKDEDGVEREYKMVLKK